MPLSSFALLILTVLALGGVTVLVLAHQPWAALALPLLALLVRKWR